MKNLLIYMILISFSGEPTLLQKLFPSPTCWNQTSWTFPNDNWQMDWQFEIKLALASVKAEFYSVDCSTLAYAKNAASVVLWKLNYFTNLTRIRYPRFVSNDASDPLL